MGNFILFLLFNKKSLIVITFIGDYSGKIDAKGRISFPSAFKKQLKDFVHEGFVLKRDIFEKCLILYPMREWERQNKIIRSRTNPYNREHGKFLRMFYSGTAEVNLDANGRLLIPKRLLDYADINADIVLAGHYGKIEMWSEQLYQSVSKADDEFALLAEKILGGSNDQNPGDDIP